MKIFTGVVAAILCLFVIAPPVWADDNSNSGDRIVDQVPDSREEAVDLLTRNFLWAEDHTQVGVDQYGREVSRQTTTVFFQGRHKRQLEGDEFYTIAGHPELAAEYRSRRTQNLWLMGLGVTAALIGPALSVWGVVGWASGTDNNPYEGNSSYVPLMIGGGVLGIGGVAAILVGRVRNDHPVEPHRRREIAEEYNLRLIEELDLEREDIPDDGDDASSIEDLRVNFQIDPNTGGGLVIGGRF